MNKEIQKYLAEIGRKGGKKSRRSLDSSQAKTMVNVREARRAFRDYYGQYFWSYSPDLKIGTQDVEWVAEQLMKYGGMKAWRKGSKLGR